MYIVTIILLLAIVVNLVLHLIYKLNFIVRMCRRKHSRYRVQYYLQFQASAGGSWNVSPMDKGGDRTRNAAPRWFDSASSSGRGVGFRLHREDLCAVVALCPFSFHP